LVDYSIHIGCNHNFGTAESSSIPWLQGNIPSAEIASLILDPATSANHRPRQIRNVVSKRTQIVDSIVNNNWLHCVTF